MATTIRNTRRMSNTTYHRRCRTQGQRRWWLRDAAGEFLEIPSRRGDQDIEVSLDLAPGTYTLGTGPQGSHGIRETIVVEG